MPSIALSAVPLGGVDADVCGLAPVDDPADDAAEVVDVAVLPDESPDDPQDASSTRLAVTKAAVSAVDRVTSAVLFFM